MAKFKDIAKGTRARKTVLFDCGLAEPVPVDVRILSPDEEIDVHAKARAFVVSKNLPDAEEGHSAFEYARAIFTLLAACIDKDSTEAKPEPFFDTAEQILHDEHLHRDNVLALYEQQQMWQDEVAKQPLLLEDAEFDRLLLLCTGDDPFPFVNLRPGKRWHFVRFLASLLVSSRLARSSSFSDSDSEIESGSPQPQSPDEEHAAAAPEGA